MVISIPAFREEGDLFHLHQYVILSVFQSPPSVRKATVLAGNSLGDGIISIPAFREEGDMSLRMFRKVSFISIPAFREEGDDG